jgi:hypothetical protein
MTFTAAARENLNSKNNMIALLPGVSSALPAAVSLSSTSSGCADCKNAKWRSLSERLVLSVHYNTVEITEDEGSSRKNTGGIIVNTAHYKSESPPAASSSAISRVCRLSSDVNTDYNTMKQLQLQPTRTAARWELPRPISKDTACVRIY